VVRRRAWSRNLKNEEAMTHVGSQRHKKKTKTHWFGVWCGHRTDLLDKLVYTFLTFCGTHLFIAVFTKSRSKPVLYIPHTWQPAFTQVPPLRLNALLLRRGDSLLFLCYPRSHKPDCHHIVQKLFFGTCCRSAS